MLIVPDTFLDLRLADNPLVIGEPRSRFYADRLLRLANGPLLGSLCLIDSRPPQLEGKKGQPPERSRAMSWGSEGR